MTYTDLHKLTPVDTTTEPKANRFGMTQAYFLGENDRWLDICIKARLPFGVQYAFKQDGFQLSIPEDCIESVDKLKQFEDPINQSEQFASMFKKGYLNIKVAKNSMFFNQEGDMLVTDSIEDFKREFPRQCEVKILATPYIWKQTNGHYGIKLKLKQVKLHSKPVNVTESICYV